MLASGQHIRHPRIGYPVEEVSNRIVGARTCMRSAWRGRLVPPMRQKVVYIVGAGHSGSTLLDLILGTHSRIESVGEIKRLERLYSGGKGSGCTCGEPFTACAYWRAIGDRLREHDIDLRAFLL